MKKIFLFLMLSLFTASVPTAYAQDTSETSSETVKKPAAAVKKKPAKKKPAKKKPAPKPVSEYKFDQGEGVHTYKFDKQANPIIKEPKPKKKTAGKKSSKKPAKIPKLKPRPALDDETPAQQGPQQRLPQQPPADEEDE